MRIFLIAFCITSCGGGMPIPKSTPQSSPEVSQHRMLSSPSPAEVEQAVMRSAHRLQEMMQANGQFTYRFHLDNAVEYAPKYNMLRHAGALYALHQYRSLLKDETVLPTIQQGALFMKQCCLKPVPDTTAQTIWQLPPIESIGHGTAKLGGAGLGLIAAVVSSNQESGAIFSIKEMLQIGDFILYMQKPDGSFYSKYVADNAARDDSWTSLYYPGEAALGLLYLNSVASNPKWVQAANRALLYLARIRRGQTDIPHDHWALIATSTLLTAAGAGENISDADRNTHTAHMVQLCLAIIKSQMRIHNSVVNGAFDPLGKTTPAATRIEGLVAAWHALPDSHQELKAQILTAIDAGVAFLIRAQIKSGVHSGALPRAVTAMSNNDAEAGRFNRRMNEVRIDYLQHALSAMLGWLTVHPTNSLKKE